MIIEVVGKEIEKIKGDFESYLNGLNMVGEISYSQYSELYDEGTKQIQKAYELGKSELEKENAELKQAKEGKVVEHFEAYGQCRDSRRIAELEAENAELRKIAEFQQSSNMSRHFENKKLKEGLAVGSILNKGLNSMNKALKEERDKYRNMVFDKNEQLTKAKELLKQFLNAKNGEDTYKAEWEAEQFISEVEK